MTLRVIGAGLGRTGTMSLKLALEKLLGAPCYHMHEVFLHLEQHVPLWHAAARGEAVDWDALFSGYAATVDWPSAAFWSEIAAAYPDALIVLSTRDSQTWWQSASQTIFPGIARLQGTPWHAMIQDMMQNTFTSALADEAAAIAAFERHNADARARAPRARLLEWTATDGWEPLCRALGLPVPNEPFPRVNTTEDVFARRAAQDAAKTKA